MPRRELRVVVGAESSDSVAQREMVAPVLRSLPVHRTLMTTESQDFPLRVVIVTTAPGVGEPCTRAPHDPLRSFVGVAVMMSSIDSIVAVEAIMSIEFNEESNNSLELLELFVMTRTLVV